MRALGAECGCGGCGADLVSFFLIIIVILGWLLTVCSMACAIREAYAATMTVVILVDDEQDRVRED